LKRAVELDQERLAASPDHRQTLMDTAISIAGLARVLEGQGDLDEAARLLDRSVEIRRRIADTDKADVFAAGLLGSALTNAARVHRKCGAPSEAQNRADEAVRILEPLFRTTSDLSARRRLAEAWLELGRAERGVGDGAASCRALRRAHDMYSERGLAELDPTLGRETAREADACR
jgi:tetratricopeptide (TPR) repeat protein